MKSQVKNATIQGDFPPPEPPGGDYTNWELQYCKWWGWTWVKKGDEASKFQQPPKKKKSGGCLSCCRKKQKPPPYYVPPPSSVRETRLDDKPMTYIQPESERSKRDDNDCCQCCCCCCCCCGNNCDQFPCGCAHSRGFKREKSRLECKCAETQTCNDIKEQCTKTSEVSIPRFKGRTCGCRKRCRCGCGCRLGCGCPRTLCCPCIKQIYCPCMTPNFKLKEERSDRSVVVSNRYPIYGKPKVLVHDVPVHVPAPASQIPPPSPLPPPSPIPSPSPVSPRDDNKGRTTPSNTDFSIPQLLNLLCLTGRPRRTNLMDLYNFKKSTNTNSLQKSLDLLLKNNINVMNILNSNRRLLKNDDSHNSGYIMNRLSREDLLQKRSDQEHDKLLNAVCDAIFSSHKLDDVVTNQLNATYSKSSEKSFNAKDSQRSLNIYSNGGIFETVLNDINYLSSDRGINEGVIREIGRNDYLKKPEPRIGPSKSLMKMIKKRSLNITAGHNSNKIDILRKNTFKTSRPEGRDYRRVCSKAKSNDVQHADNFTKPIITNIFNRTDNEPCSSHWQLGREPNKAELFSRISPRSFKSSEEEVTTKQVQKTNIDDKNTQQILDYIKNNCQSSSHNRQGNTYLLDLTSPPFTSADMTCEDVQQGNNVNERTQNAVDSH